MAKERLKVQSPVVLCKSNFFPVVLVVCNDSLEQFGHGDALNFWADKVPAGHFAKLCLEHVLRVGNLLAAARFADGFSVYVVTDPPKA